MTNNNGPAGATGTKKEKPVMSDRLESASIWVGSNSNTMALHSIYIDHASYYSPVMKEALTRAKLSQPDRVPKMDIQTKYSDCFTPIKAWMYNQTLIASNGKPLADWQLIHVWLLAHKLRMPIKLQNLAMKQLIGLKPSKEGAREIDYVYDNTGPKSKMRAFLIEKYGFEAGDEVLFGQDATRDPISKEFFTDLGKTYKRDGDALREKYYGPNRVAKFEDCKINNKNTWNAGQKF